jgi:hypothetical protein
MKALHRQRFLMPIVISIFNIQKETFVNVKKYKIIKIMPFAT